MNRGRTGRNHPIGPAAGPSGGRSLEHLPLLQEEDTVDTTLPVPRHPVDVPVLVRTTAQLLRSGVPLTLLLDLAEPGGPRSQLRYADDVARDWSGR